MVKKIDNCQKASQNPCKSHKIKDSLQENYDKIGPINPNSLDKSKNIIYNAFK